MAYTIKLSSHAEADLEVLYAWVTQSTPKRGHAWFLGLEQAIYSLKEIPTRCPKAPESVRFSVPIYHLLYGHKPYIYRILFTIDQADKQVYVLHIRHGSRKTANRT